MADPVFRDSPYKFTDPVRYFKANDPYYWEVDNIPLKQIQENALWLKDQIGPQKMTSLDRSDWAELRPYADGQDEYVRVLPGRYTARINSIDPTRMQGISGGITREGDSVGPYKVMDGNEATMAAILDKFKSYLADNITNMNGLAERAFTYPVGEGIDYTAYGQPWFHSLVSKPTFKNATQGIEGLKQPIFPISEALLWAHGSNSGGELYELYSYHSGGPGWSRMNILENHWIKYWKGAFRTAVVDVPEELKIAVPEFDDKDFFYWKDKSTSKTTVTGATRRIDLLFLYTKPVDATAVSIHKFNSGGTAKKIDTPELGILKGAGLGLDFRKATIDDNYDPIKARDAQDREIMLANPSDEFDEQGGFKKVSIHGSFPAPDDLLNLSPLINQNFGNDHYPLLGQTILPIAYIVTDTTTQGTITNSNIIDIRPFFRTTELAYNERAGIAAAYPQLSFANPAVGKSELMVHDSKIREYNERTFHKKGGGSGPLGTPRLIAAGHVFGGYNYGVESVLVDYETYKGAKGSDAAKANLVAAKYGFPTNSIPAYPQWDRADWCENNNSITDKGDEPNDYIEVIHGWDGDYGTAKFGSYQSNAKSTPSRLSVIAGASNFQTLPPGTGGNLSIGYVRKTCRVNMTALSKLGFKDFKVKAQLLNCIPITFAGKHSGGISREAVSYLWESKASGIWVEKKWKNSGIAEFTIYVSWAVNDMYRNLQSGGIRPQHPANHRTLGDEFNGFVVLTEGIRKSSPDRSWIQTPLSEPRRHLYGKMMNQGSEKIPYGTCTYPTVSFEVVGIPEGWMSNNTGTPLNTTNPLISIE